MIGMFIVMHGNSVFSSVFSSVLAMGDRRDTSLDMGFCSVLTADTKSFLLTIAAVFAIVQPLW